MDSVICRHCSAVFQDNTDDGTDTCPDCAYPVWFGDGEDPIELDFGDGHVSVYPEDIEE